jgi:hypothetical protein
MIHENENYKPKPHKRMLMSLGDYGVSQAKLACVLLVFKLNKCIIDNKYSKKVLKYNQVLSRGVWPEILRPGVHQENCQKSDNV